MNILKASFTIAVLVGIGSLLITGCASHDHHKDHSGHSHTSMNAKPYPLKTCIVTDEPLGGHGEAVTLAYQGQEIKLCCEDCRAPFDKEPAKYLKKLTAAK